jgi:hypothetical protein
VQYTNSPDAGVAMAFICTLVIRGAKNPLLVLLTSNAAELLGVEVPIPIWEKETVLTNKAKIDIVFFMVFFYLLI